MANVKGSAITARIRYVRELHGEEGYRRVLGALPDAVRAQLQGGRILPHAWVPFEVFVALNTEIDRIFGQGDLALCLEMGRYSAEVNLPTLYRIFYQFSSPLFVLRKAARLWEVHYDSGRLETMSEGNGHARLSIVDFAEPHRAHCGSVLGWATKSVELSGGFVTAADEVQCRTVGAATCDIVLRWRS